MAVVRRKFNKKRMKQAEPVVLSSIVLSLAACGGSEPQSAAQTNTESEASGPQANQPITTSVLLNPDGEPGISYNLSASQSIMLPSSGGEVVLIAMSASSESSTLSNENSLPIKAFQYDDINGLRDVSSSVLEGGPSSVLTRNIIIADFDGNGYADAFLNNHGTEANQPFPGEENILLLNDGEKLRVAQDFNLPTFKDFSHNGSAGDFNGDGYEDLFVINFGSSGVNADYFLLGGPLSFSDPIYVRGTPPEGGVVIVSGYEQGLSIPASVSIDTDQNGTVEVIGPKALDDELGVRFTTLNVEDTASVTFAVSEIAWAGSPEGAHQAVSADLNGDGFDDALFYGFTPNGNGMLQMLLSTDEGLVDASTQLGDTNGVFPVAQGILDFKVVDYDNDGDSDILFVRYDEDWSQYGVALENDGNANFTAVDFPSDTISVFHVLANSGETSQFLYVESQVNEMLVAQALV